MQMTDLENALLAAHERGDGTALAHLYHDAARLSTGEAAAFFLCQAYVFALESGESIAEVIHGLLVELGREA